MDNNGNGQWTVAQAMSFRFRVERHYADITYSLSDGSTPVQVKNLVTHGEEVEMNPFSYLRVLDVLYPEYSKTGPTEGTLQDYLSITTVLALDSINSMVERGLQIVLLPLTQLQYFYSKNEEPILNASFSRSGYRLTVALSSIKVFTLLCIIIVAWCIGLLAISSFGHRPEVSAFPELDLISKIPVTSDNGSTTGALEALGELPNSKSRDIACVLSKIRVCRMEQDYRREIIGDTTRNVEVIPLNNMD